MSRTRPPTRITALAVICFAIGGLAFVRLGDVPETREVPDGASAGDVVPERCDDRGAAEPD